MLKREQNHVVRSLPKKRSRSKHIVCHHCGAFGHLRPHCSMFQAFKRIKRKEKLELLGSCALQAKLDLVESGKLLKHVVNAFTSLSMCIFGSRLLTLVSLLMRYSFQTNVLFGRVRVPMVELMLF